MCLTEPSRTQRYSSRACGEVQEDRIAKLPRPISILLAREKATDIFFRVQTARTPDVERDIERLDPANLRSELSKSDLNSSDHVVQ